MRKILWPIKLWHSLDVFQVGFWIFAHVNLFLTSMQNDTIRFHFSWFTCPAKSPFGSDWTWSTFGRQTRFLTWHGQRKGSWRRIEILETDLGIVRFSRTWIKHFLQNSEVKIRQKFGKLKTQQIEVAPNAKFCFVLTQPFNAKVRQRIFVQFQIFFLKFQIWIFLISRFKSKAARKIWRPYQENVWTMKTLSQTVHTTPSPFLTRL